MFQAAYLLALATCAYMGFTWDQRTPTKETHEATNMFGPEGCRPLRQGRAPNTDRILLRGI